MIRIGLPSNWVGSPQNEIAPADIEDIDIMEPIAFERWALRRCITLGWKLQVLRSLMTWAPMVFLFIASPTLALSSSVSINKAQKTFVGLKP